MAYSKGRGWRSDVLVAAIRGAALDTIPCPRTEKTIMKPLSLLRAAFLSIIESAESSSNIELATVLRRP